MRRFARGRNTQIASGPTRREVALFVDAVIAMLEPMKSHYLWRPQSHDPNDEMVLKAAINGHASILATFNVRDFLPAKHFGIEVLRPYHALKRLVE